MSLAQFDLEPVGLDLDPDNDDTAPYDRNELAERFAEQFVFEATRPPARGLRVWLADWLDRVATRIWGYSDKLRVVRPRGGA